MKDWISNLSAGNSTENRFVYFFSAIFRSNFKPFLQKAKQIQSDAVSTILEKNETKPNLSSFVSHELLTWQMNVIQLFMSYNNINFPLDLYPFLMEPITCCFFSYCSETFFNESSSSFPLSLTSSLCILLSYITALTSLYSSCQSDYRQENTKTSLITKILDFVLLWGPLR